MTALLCNCLVVVLAVITLLGLARSLPVQNVLAVAACLLVFGGMLEWGLAGSRMHAGLATWLSPFLWVGLILGARAVAKFFLRRWREDLLYGVWLIFLAGAITALGCFLLGERDWLFLAVRFGAALVSLTAIVPWMIRKKPEPGKI